LCLWTVKTSILVHVYWGGLQPYPPAEEVDLLAKTSDAYTHARSYLDAHQADKQDGRPFANTKVVCGKT